MKDEEEKEEEEKTRTEQPDLISTTIIITTATTTTKQRRRPLHSYSGRNGQRESPEERGPSQTTTAQLAKLTTNR